ncbi:MAG: two-component regulator propeller domain-containing protein [Bacteroidota bacterium]
MAALLLAAPLHAQPTPAGQAPPSSSTPASTNQLDPAKLPTQYRASMWTGDDGLPQSNVDALAQTTDGYLWAATQAGVGRFDGQAFETISTRSHSALRSNNTDALAADASGALWIGTSNGLARLRPDGALSVFDEAQGLPAAPIYALAADDARLWVGTAEGLCWARLPAKAPAFTCRTEGLPDPQVGTLLTSEDADGQAGVWVGTGAGLAWFDAATLTAYDHLGGVLAAPILSLAADPETPRRLWIGGLDGLALLDLDGYRPRVTAPIPQLSQARIAELIHDPSGALWIGTDGDGLFRWQASPSGTPQLDVLNEAAGEALMAVGSLLMDREGGLWVGVPGKGLLHLRDAKLTPFGSPEGLQAAVAYSIAEGRRGRVWVGTDGGGVSRIQGGRVVETIRADGESGLASDFVNAVTETRDGTLWVGTNGDGLARCVRAGGWRCTTLSLDDGLPDPWVLALYESRDGTLWIGTDAGIVRARAGRLLPGVLTEAEGLGSASVNTFEEDASGAVWAGTYGGGLSRIDVRGGAAAVAETITTEDGLSYDLVLDILAGSDGCLWIGTYGGGLTRRCLDAQGSAAYTTYSTREGLPSDGILSLLEDDAGTFWINTDRGLVHLLRSDLTPDREGEVRLSPETLGVYDGARDAEGTGGVGPAALRASDGRLWFPTIDGVVVLDPGALPSNRVAPPVAVQRVLVGGEAQPLGPALNGALTLPPGSREFEFDFAALTFFAPSDVRYRYRLDGRDNAWNAPVARRQAFYTDLRPGTYTFRVQAANNDGVWNDHGAAISFTLQPYFYQTTWFLVLCLLLGLGTVYGGFAMRVRQLRRRAEHLEAVVTERTRELAEEKERVVSQKSVIEEQAGALRELNEQLEQRVRDQLAEIVRGSRLRKFFSKKVVDRILTADEDVAVVNERKRVTVLFSDLKGFTRFSDTTDPGVVTGMLNAYLTEMVALIEAHGGTLDKFMGDGIMALFGAADHMQPDEQARQAVHCAAAMQHAFRRLRAAWAAASLPASLDLRVGVNQAEVMVGNFGSDDLVEYTAIGQGVNLAARLESACTPGQALVSFPVYALTKDHFPYSDEEAYQLKGIERPVPAYTLRTDAMDETAVDAQRVGTLALAEHRASAADAAQ